MAAAEPCRRSPRTTIQVGAAARVVACGDLETRSRQAGPRGRAGRQVARTQTSSTSWFLWRACPNPRTASPRRRKELVLPRATSALELSANKIQSTISPTCLPIGIAWGALKNTDAPFPSHPTRLRDSDVGGLCWGLGIWTFQSFPGDSQLAAKCEDP